MPQSISHSILYEKLCCSSYTAVFADTAVVVADTAVVAAVVLKAIAMRGTFVVVVVVVVVFVVVAAAAEGNGYGAAGTHHTAVDTPVAAGTRTTRPDWMNAGGTVALYGLPISQKHGW